MAARLVASALSSAVTTTAKPSGPASTVAIEPAGAPAGRRALESVVFHVVPPSFDVCTRTRLVVPDDALTGDRFAR